MEAETGLDKSLLPTYKVEFRSAQSGHILMKNVLQPHKRLHRDVVGPEGPTESGWLRQATSDHMPESPGFVLPEGKQAETPRQTSHKAALERLQAGKIQEPPKRPRAMYEMPQPPSDAERLRKEVAAAAERSAQVATDDLGMPTISSSSPIHEPRQRVASTIDSRPLSRTYASADNLGMPTISPSPILESRQRVDNSIADSRRLSRTYSTGSPSFASTASTRVASPVVRQASSPMVMDPPSRPRRSNSSHHFPPFTPHVMEPRTFDVVLILDNREVKSKKDRDGLVRALQQKGVEVEQRPLGVGDVIWVARKVGFSYGPHLEIVLDGVLERKRVDDLVQSILGGRYDEQKVRHATPHTGDTPFFYVTP
jgi:hypothetical protein